MAQLLIKFVVCPLVILLIDIFSHDMNYQFMYQPIIVGIVLAAVGRFLEYFLLQGKTVWISTILDFLTTMVIVYFSRYFFAGSMVTLFSAFVTALILGIMEHIQHMIFVIRAQRAKNQP